MLGAVTATASFRFSKWIGRWLAASGARLIIGKGGLLVFFLLILVAFTFALFGFLIGLMSSNFEQMSIIPTLIITPMVFLGGSLYSLDMLPPFWQTVTYFNPVVYLINGLRFAFYGVSDFNIWISISSMVFFLIVCF